VPKKIFFRCLTGLVDSADRRCAVSRRQSAHPFFFFTFPFPFGFGLVCVVFGQKKTKKQRYSFFPPPRLCYGLIVVPSDRSVFSGWRRGFGL